MTSHVAVIDIGKTNAKLALVDRHSLTEIAVVTRPNVVKTGPPWPHFDVAGHWRFLLEGLRDFHASHGVNAIAITTHGACAALLAENSELAAPILDYEYPGPDTVGAAYDAIRPSFAETGSPRLAQGLNIGAQLHWQFGQDPELMGRTRHIVTYPQFWAARLTGVVATDPTSLGCHTDLWNPHSGGFSSLAATLGIKDKLAPVRKPSDILGPILPDIADRTGLPPDTPVHCGIHDSNASLLPYVLTGSPPFSVVSTGTWVVVMSVGGDRVSLDPALDTLINVTATGAPANSARFMGGREHDLATGGAYPTPSDTDLAEVLAEGIMLLPAVVPESGPFRGRRASWVGGEPAHGSAKRGAAVSLYLALMTAKCLRNVGHAGKVIVEGPFAANRHYLQMLTAVTGTDVYAATGTTGTSAGAALLAAGPPVDPPRDSRSTAISATLRTDLQAYATRWTATIRHKPTMRAGN